MLISLGCTMTTPSAIDDETTCTWKVYVKFGKMKISELMSLSFNVSNSFWKTFVHTYLISFFNNFSRGVVMLA